MSLPPHLNQAIVDYLSTTSQKEQKKAFEKLSTGYRSFQNKTLGSTKQDVEAYLLGRFPLTRAVLVHLIEQLVPYLPSHFSVIDFGSGPGTALWALDEALPSHTFDYIGIESKQAMIDAAKVLASSCLRSCKFVLQSVEKPVEAHCDVAIVSYLLNELQNESMFFDLLFQTADFICVVEPGTIDGYSRLMRLREKAIEKGFAILAPCPHKHKCPMPQGKWCHFSLRVPRSKMLKAIKGGTLGYEDEKYSYLIFSKKQNPLGFPVIVDRPQELGFGLKFHVCSPSGNLESIQVLKRDKEAFRAVKKKDWGDFF